VLHLGLSQNELATIGLKVGADVPFFIYGYNAANVGGIGEVVEKFDEELLDFEVYTPKIEISTPKVYQAYRKDFYAPVDEEEIQRYKNITSLKALQTKTAEELNDLFKPALQEYKDLKSHYKNGYFFSGSGSSFFKVKEEK
jgi:4-diphosphocytidyl-2-C-methyl-D-erythritol kinase